MTLQEFEAVVRIRVQAADDGDLEALLADAFDWVGIEDWELLEAEEV